MKKNRNLILIVVIILLLAAGIYFLFKDDNKGMNTASSSAPSIEFHNSDVKETKDGKIVWRFKAGHAKVSKDQNFIDMEQVEGDEIGKLVDIPMEAQKIGGNRVSVTYTDASGTPDLELPTGAAAGIRIEFDRSSGSFKDAPLKMRIQGGSRDYKLDFIKLTGKIAVNRTTS